MPVHMCVCMKERMYADNKEKVCSCTYIQKERKEDNQLAASISMSVVGDNGFFDVAAVTSGFFNVSKSSTTTTNFFHLPACFLFVCVCFFLIKHQFAGLVALKTNWNHLFS